MSGAFPTGMLIWRHMYLQAYEAVVGLSQRIRADSINIKDIRHVRKDRECIGVYRSVKLLYTPTI